MFKHIKTINFTKKDGKYIQSKNSVIIDAKSNTYNVESDYISIDEIYKKLKEQKQVEKQNKPIASVEKINKTIIPVDMNTFCIHQHSYNDIRNKIHKELQKEITTMIHKNYLTNHIILHGLAGSGKYTMGMSILHHIYGDNINKRIIKSQLIDKKTIKYIENPYYIEILINNYVLNDNYTLTTFIRNHSKNKRNKLCQSNGLYQNTESCQYIVIKHFDELTRQCQKNLFHLMEKLLYVKFIITTRHLGKIIDNIKSNSCIVRVPRPDSKLLAKYLNRIAKANKFIISHNSIRKVKINLIC